VDESPVWSRISPPIFPEPDEREIDPPEFKVFVDVPPITKSSPAFDDDDEPVDNNNEPDALDSEFPVPKASSPLPIVPGADTMTTDPEEAETLDPLIKRSEPPISPNEFPPLIDTAPPAEGPISALPPDTTADPAENPDITSPPKR
jgi:hypothetical protein